MGYYYIFLESGNLSDDLLGISDYDIEDVDTDSLKIAYEEIKAELKKRN